MHTAVRPYVTAGVALVGASVIAVTPIAARPPDIQIAAPHVSSASVTLTALVDPITAYTQLFTNTANNLAGLGGEILANPTPILSAIVANSIDNGNILAAAGQDAFTALTQQLAGLPAVFQTAGTQAAAGNIAGAVDTVFSGLSGVLLGSALPLVGGLVQVAQNIAGNFNDVVQNGILAVLLAALAPIYPINATVSAFGALAQDVFTSVTTGDFLSVAEDFVSAPAVLLNAFLNGFPQGQSSFIDPAGGLLTTAAVGFGTIENLLQARTSIANILRPPAAPAAASAPAANVLPDVAASSVTLNPTSIAAQPAPAQAPAQANSGLTTAADNAPARAEQGLASAAQGGGNAADALAKAQDKAPANADPGLSKATQKAGNRSGATDLTTGNKATPDKPASNDNKSGGGRTGAVKSVSDQIGSGLSKLGGGKAAKGGDKG